MGPWGHPESEQSRRSKSTQEQSVSMSHLDSGSLSVRLVPSTIPELWGLYAVCSFHFIRFSGFQTETRPGGICVLPKTIKLRSE